MEGVSAVLARIGEIESRLASLAPPTAGGVSFGQQLRAAAATAPAASSPVPAAAPEQPSAAWNRSTGLAGSRPTARLDGDGVPVELAAYGNGKVPATALRSIGGGHRLWAPAAEAFTAMEAAAARDGVRLGVTDSYRSYEAQVDVAARKGLYSQGGLAARPGTSDHGWGRSLDLDLDGAALRWMRAHGREHGFVEDTPRESWHWTFTPAA